MSSSQSQWQGGKSFGSSIKPKEGKYIVSFTSEKFKHEKSFNISSRVTAESALQSATEYQKRKSLENGLYKNMYRFLQDSNGKYIEVKLDNQDEVMFCDEKNLSYVEERVWYATPHTNTQHKYHIRAKKEEEKNYKSDLLHKVLFPNIRQFEYIDGNCLNLRSFNVRESTVPKTRYTHPPTSDIQGVYFDEGGARWVAQWTEFGKRKKKNFNIAKYKKLNLDAKEEAIKFRQTQVDYKSPKLKKKKFESENKEENSVFIEHIPSVVIEPSPNRLVEVSLHSNESQGDPNQPEYIKTQAFYKKYPDIDIKKIQEESKKLGSITRKNFFKSIPSDVKDNEDVISELQREAKKDELESAGTVIHKFLKNQDTIRLGICMIHDPQIVLCVLGISGVDYYGPLMGSIEALFERLKISKEDLN